MLTQPPLMHQFLALNLSIPIYARYFCHVLTTNISSNDLVCPVLPLPLQRPPVLLQDATLPGSAHPNTFINSDSGEGEGLAGPWEGKAWM